MLDFDRARGGATRLVVTGRAPAACGARSRSSKPDYPPAQRPARRRSRRPPEGDLARVVARVRELDLAPAVVLVSGDLTEHGDKAEYARVRELLEPLRGPVLALPGNHDDSAALRARSPRPRTTARCGC